MAFAQETQPDKGRTVYVCVMVCDGCDNPIATGSEWRRGAASDVPESAAQSARDGAARRAAQHAAMTGKGRVAPDGTAQCKACLDAAVREARAARVAADAARVAAESAARAAHTAAPTGDAVHAWGDPEKPDGIPHVTVTPVAGGFRVLLQMRVAGILGTAVCVLSDEHDARARGEAWFTVAPECARAIRDTVEAILGRPQSREFFVRGAVDPARLALAKARREGITLAVAV